LTFKASDRVGNVNLSKKKIILEKPLKTTLIEISKKPQKYVGKVLLLEGYAWGWYAKNRPPEVEKLSQLPLAKGNTAKTKNTGTFSDGTALAFFPISPVEAGKFRIYAIIHIVKDKWLLKPLFTEKIL